MGHVDNDEPQPDLFRAANVAASGAVDLQNSRARSSLQTKTGCLPGTRNHNPPMQMPARPQSGAFVRGSSHKLYRLIRILLISRETSEWRVNETRQRARPCPQISIDKSGRRPNSPAGHD